MTEQQQVLYTKARILRRQATALRVIEHELHEQAKALSEEAWKLIQEAFGE